MCGPALACGPRSVAPRPDFLIGRALASRLRNSDRFPRSALFSSGVSRGLLVCRSSLCTPYATPKVILTTTQVVTLSHEKIGVVEMRALRSTLESRLLVRVSLNTILYDMYCDGVRMPNPKSRHSLHTIRIKRVYSERAVTVRSTGCRACRVYVHTLSMTSSHATHNDTPLHHCSARCWNHTCIQCM